MHSENTDYKDQWASERKFTRFLTIFLGLFYLLIIPYCIIWGGVLCYILLALLNNSDYSRFFQIFFNICALITYFSVPLSILVSVWRIRSRYKKKNYRGARLCLLWPLYVLAFVSILDCIYLLYITPWTRSSFISNVQGAYYLYFGL
jgi:uncharacterized membrane protein